MMTAAEKRLVERAIRAITGPDMDYYACIACHEKYQHAPDCLVIKLRRAITVKKPRKAVKSSPKKG